MFLAVENARRLAAAVATLREAPVPMRMVLAVGESGVGKTTAVRMLADRKAAEALGLEGPVRLVPVDAKGGIGEMKRGIARALGIEARRWGPRVKEEVFRGLSGAVLAVDDVHDAGAREQRFLRWLHDTVSGLVIVLVALPSFEVRVRDFQLMRRCFFRVEFRRWTEEELLGLVRGISDGVVTEEAARRIVKFSRGLPGAAFLLSTHARRVFTVNRIREAARQVSALERIRRELVLV